MKLLIALSALVAAAVAAPSGVATLAYAAAPIAAPVIISPAASQFHVQDTLGQYSYGYSNAQSAKSEARSANGLTVGGFKYVDGDGKLQSVEYSSDVNGFRVAASNLPVAPAVPEVPALVQPVPVQDTPEVVEARARHLATVEEIKARSITQVVTPLAAPAVAVQPAVPAAPAPVAVVKTASSATVEATSTNAPVVEAKPAPPSTETNSTATLGIELRSGLVPAGTINTVLTPTVALAPSLAVRALPAVGAPLAFGYSFNTLHGINAAVVQPAFTTYSVPLGAQVLGATIAGKAAPTEAATEAKESSD